MSAIRSWRKLMLALGLVLYALVPFFWTSDAWLGFAINVMIMSVLAIGWNISGGFGGMLSFGHAALFGTGAYAAAMLQLQAGWNPWCAAAGGVAMAAAVGAFIGAVASRYGLRGSYFSLVTLAFSEVLRVCASSFDFTGGGQGLQLRLNESWSHLQFPSRMDNYLFVLALVLLALLLSWLIQRSRFGAYLAAIRENEEASQALGIPTFRVKVLAMLMAGVLCGAAGVAYLQTYLYVDAHIAYGSAMSIEALLGATIGGAGTILGPVLGTVVLHTLGELVKEMVGGAPGVNLVVYGIVMLLILRFLPNGLSGLFESRTRRMPAATKETK